MEHSVYYDKSVESIIKQYFRKLHLRKIVGMVLICIDAVALYGGVELWGYSVWESIIILLYILSVCFIALGIKLFDFRYFTNLSKILYYDCDPVKYETIIKRLQEYDKRGKAQATFSLELAAATLAQKYTDEGYRYLKHVTFKRFMMYQELKRLCCYAAYYELIDDFSELHRIKTELERLRINNKSYFNQAISHRISMVEAMESRESESIESQKQRWSSLYCMAENPLQENVLLMRLAKLEWQQGKSELSMRHMRFVAMEGNTLSCVREAIQILSSVGSIGDNNI